MDMIDEAQPVVDPTCVALLASMPGRPADVARDIRDLFAVSGCPVREAPRNVAELSSPAHHGGARARGAARPPGVPELDGGLHL